MLLSNISNTKLLVLLIKIAILECFIDRFYIKIILLFLTFS